MKKNDEFLTDYEIKFKELNPCFELLGLMSPWDRLIVLIAS